MRTHAAHCSRRRRIFLRDHLVGEVAFAHARKYAEEHARAKHARRKHAAVPLNDGKQLLLQRSCRFGGSFIIDSARKRRLLGDGRFSVADILFVKGGALAELNKNWLTARRAIMRKPIDRMGFGGYLSLAAKFPAFINRVAEIADEFRTIYDAVDNKKPYCRLKVALLNAWGEKRSWMSHMVAHELWYQQIYSYQGILEALSGLPVDVDFLSFEDAKRGVSSDIDVIINAGDTYTVYSGGNAWLDEELQTAIRKFVYNGGGFIGVGEPTACSANGRYFQLADVLGVDEEVGLTLSVDKYNIQKVKHELTKEKSTFDYGEDKKNIYALEGSEVLDITFSERFNRSVNVGEVKIAVNHYGNGRSFYISGIPYSFENSRLLGYVLDGSQGFKHLLLRQRQR